MKYFYPALVLLFTPSIIFCQLVSYERIDTAFPITNSFSSVFNIASANGVYYIDGDFTRLAKNLGSTIIYDTATKQIIGSRCRINGVVNTCIPDGAGGFFIGGTFTKIGDSSRPYLAQINAFGQATNWRPVPDSFINHIQKRNDTLFIAGDFTKFNNANKRIFAIYNLSGDTLIKNGAPALFNYISSMSAFLLDHDTIIYTGPNLMGSIGAIGKYNFRKNTVPGWKLNYYEYGPCSNLQFNEDSSVIIYRSESSPTILRAAAKGTGDLLYSISIQVSSLKLNPFFDLKVVGKKGYLVGDILSVYNKIGLQGNGFFVFNATTGQLLNDSISIDGNAVHVNFINGKLILSGTFTKVNGIDRVNFAVLDTGTYLVNNLDLSPTDPITCTSSNGASFFMSGRYLNGLYSVRRDGYAAIDSATGDILPWKATNTLINAGRKMVVKGDTLFVLGMTRQSGCQPGYFEAELRIFKTSTNQELAYWTQISDFLIDGEYLYTTAGGNLGRYNLKSLTYDPLWGDKHYGRQYKEILISGDTIYLLGDNMSDLICTSLPLRYAFFTKALKSTGKFVSSVKYSEENAIYTYPRFEHGIISGDHLFVYGAFRSLNGKSLLDFACINKNDGSLTDWQPPIKSKSGSTDYRSGFKLYKGNICLALTSDYDLTAGGIARGFVPIDTSDGSIDIKSMISESVSDFILNDNELVLVGGFASAKDIPGRNLIRFILGNTSSGKIYTFSGNGSWSDKNNWSNGMLPPSVLPTGSQIVINPQPGGVCTLDIPATISAGASFTVAKDARFIISNNLELQHL